MEATPKEIEAAERELTMACEGPLPATLVKELPDGAVLIELTSRDPEWKHNDPPRTRDWRRCEREAWQTGSPTIIRESIVRIRKLKDHRGVPLGLKVMDESLNVVQLIAEQSAALSSSRR